MNQSFSKIKLKLKVCISNRLFPTIFLMILKIKFVLALMIKKINILITNKMKKLL